MVQQSDKIEEKTSSDGSDSETAVGSFYEVKLSNGETHPAQILAKRISPYTSGVIQYYVHYAGFDRRLDEWVNPERIGKVVENVKHDSISEEQVRLRLTRKQRRRHEEINHVQKSYTELDPRAAELEKEYEERTKVKYIDTVRFGKFIIDTWYFSPYPDEFGKAHHLYICEYCLKYMRFPVTYEKHKNICTKRQPPGKEIYRKQNLSVYQIDGKEHKLYCQLLCLFAKMFFDHKTLYFGVEHFMFYVLCQVDKAGAHIVGYFSKEKQSTNGNNLSCILTLPPYQRQGYGRFLIQLSYELSKFEGTIGSPEKPLSDLGSLGYRSYWTTTLLEELRGSHAPGITIDELSKRTHIAPADIISTLQSLNMIIHWRGQYSVCTSAKQVESTLAVIQKDIASKPRLTLDPNCLAWAPHRLECLKRASSMSD